MLARLQQKARGVVVIFHSWENYLETPHLYLGFPSKQAWAEQVTVGRERASVFHKGRRKKQKKADGHNHGNWTSIMSPL